MTRDSFHFSQAKQQGFPQYIRFTVQYNCLQGPLEQESNWKETIGTNAVSVFEWVDKSSIYQTRMNEWMVNKTFFFL